MHTLKDNKKRTRVGLVKTETNEGRNDDNDNDTTKIKCNDATAFSIKTDERCRIAS